MIYIERTYRGYEDFLSTEGEHKRFAGETKEKVLGHAEYQCILAGLAAT